MKKKLLRFTTVLLAVVAVVMIYRDNHRSISFDKVPNYDLLVRDVAKGDETIQIVPMEAMPEDEYYYGVSYKGGILKLRAQGYMVEGQSLGMQYGVDCKPRAFYEQGITPNGELWGTPVRFSQTAEVREDNYWSSRIVFELGDHVYQVYCRSFNGAVEGADAHLRRMAAGLIPGAPETSWEADLLGLTGTWSGYTQASVLGVGVEEPTTLDGTVNFTFLQDEWCTVETDFGLDIPTVSSGTSYSIEGDRLTIGDQIFTFSIEGDTLTLDGRAHFELTRVS